MRYRGQIVGTGSHKTVLVNDDRCPVDGWTLRVESEDPAVDNKPGDTVNFDLEKVRELWVAANVSNKS